MAEWVLFWSVVIGVTGSVIAGGARRPGYAVTFGLGLIVAGTVGAMIAKMFGA